MRVRPKKRRAHALVQQVVERDEHGDESRCIGAPIAVAVHVLRGRAVLAHNYLELAQLRVPAERRLEECAGLAGQGRAERRGEGLLDGRGRRGANGHKVP